MFKFLGGEFLFISSFLLSTWVRENTTTSNLQGFIIYLVVYTAVSNVQTMIPDFLVGPRGGGLGVKEGWRCGGGRITVPRHHRLNNGNSQNRSMQLWKIFHQYNWLSNTRVPFLNNWTMYHLLINKSPSSDPKQWEAPSKVILMAKTKGVSNDGWQSPSLSPLSECTCSRKWYRGVIDWWEDGGEKGFLRGRRWWWWWWGKGGGVKSLRSCLTVTSFWRS